jgi:hypothetical protein
MYLSADEFLEQNVYAIEQCIWQNNPVHNAEHASLCGKNVPPP